MRKIKNKALEKDLKKYIKEMEKMETTMRDGTEWSNGYAQCLDAMTYDIREILEWWEDEEK